MIQKLYRIIRYDLPLFLVLLLTNWLPDFVFVLRIRGWLASFFFKKCGENLRLGRNITFYNPKNITIGNDVYIAYGGWFSASDKIHISSETIFGPYVVCSSSNHTKLSGSFRYGTPLKSPIYVEEGCWIGSHSILTAGAVVGRGALVAANSVVNKRVDKDTFVAGSPIKFIKKV